MLFKSKEDYGGTKNFFVENKIKFFTYTLQSEKTTSLINCGLDQTDPAQEITEHLKNEDISSVLSVKPFVTWKARQDGDRLACG